MSSIMHCPRCGSTNVDCTLKPTHQHRCVDCGYDGTSREISRFAMLDVWLALGGRVGDFEAWMAAPKRTPADAWAQILAAIRGDGMWGDCNPEPGLILDRVRTATA